MGFPLSLHPAAWHAPGLVLRPYRRCAHDQPLGRSVDRPQVEPPDRWPVPLGRPPGPLATGGLAKPMGPVRLVAGPYRVQPRQPRRIPGALPPLVPGPARRAAVPGRRSVGPPRGERVGHAARVERSKRSVRRAEGQGYPKFAP